MPPRLLYAVSSHGFGHATRSAAVLTALVRAGVPPENLHVRSEAPAWIFTRRVAGLPCSEAPIDPGLRQPNGLDLDRQATLDAHVAFAEHWEENLDREADVIHSFGADAVVADIPPLACAAAARAGVPAYVVANFSWDWILAEYQHEDPRWPAIIARYRSAYARARRLYRTPLHGDLSIFPRIHDVPFVVNHTTRTKAECRADLGIPPDERRRIILVSFGGFGASEVQPSRDEDLSAYLFLSTAEVPDGFPGEWRALSHPSQDPHEHLVQAADALIGKPGYSTAAEALAHQTRTLYVPRLDFREVDPLLEGLHALGCARPIPRADFESGRWRQHLDALFEQPLPPFAPPHDGADMIASHLLAELTNP